MQGAQTLANLGNNQRDFQFRQQESDRSQRNADRGFQFQTGQAERSQSNADRSFGLQQQTAKLGTIQKVKDAAGNETLVRIDNQGNALPLDVPGTGAANKTNPYAFGKMTDTQSKDALYASRMFGAEKLLRDPAIVDAATSVPQQTMSRIPGVGNFMVSDSFQKYDQAKRDFVNATLRRESGAVISEAEFSNAEKQYFPRPGDSKAVIEQKRRNRAEAIKGIAAGAGQSYRPQNVFGPNGEIVDNPALQQQPQQAAPQAGQGPRQIGSKAEFDALPSGTQFVAPDGSVRIKP
jgi:hypothetical protein